MPISVPCQSWTQSNDVNNFCTLLVNYGNIEL